MSLTLTEEQRQIQAEARRFLAADYAPDRLRELLNACDYDTALWRSFADMGWTGAGVPETFGGLGLGPLEVCLIAEECGGVVASVPFLAANYAMIDAIARHGDDALQSALLPAFAAGEARGALALLDENVLAPRCTFRNGKVFGLAPSVSGGARATHALVYAQGDRPTLVAVDLNAPGAAVTPLTTFDSTRCVGDLTFDGAHATPLAAADAGAAALDTLALWACVLAFEQVGGGEAAMHRARAYACERQAFGQPIGKFQAIKHRIAEMYVANELARGNALLAAAGFAVQAPDRVLRAAAARLTAGHAFEFAAAEAIQIHGAIGATWEHDLHFYLRRSRSLALEAGARFLWEDIIADALQAAAA